MVGADSDDNTTPGITCARARMKSLFASKCQTVLPTEAELAAMLRRQEIWGAG